MLSLVKDTKDLGETDGHAASVVGRLMSIFMHHKFLHYHGQHGARLCRDQSVHGENSTSRTPLILCLSPIFFNAPEVHLRGLETLWVDGLVNQLPWGHFIVKLKSDWQEFVLYATVMLNANVAFLTIPDVDPGAGEQTIAKVFSFISIITSVGSIILGLLLVRHHRVKPRETAQDVVGYLQSRKHPTLGLETLSILYSLPYALLMWAMVTFLVAFACECFVYPHIASIYSTAVFWVIIGSLIFWCIYILWDSDSGESAWDSLIHSSERLLSRTRQKVISAPKVLSAICAQWRVPPAVEPMHPLGVNHDIERS